MQIKRICLILSHKKQQSAFARLIKKLQERGIICEVLLAGEEYAEASKTLYITDASGVYEELARKGLPVLVYYHQENRGEDFGAARYAMEQPEELEPQYLDRVYRRFAGLPWDILETEHCLLRESTVEDVDAFYAIYKEPAIARYMEDLFADRISEQAYIREYIEKVYSYYEFGIWTIVLKETGEIIGRAGLSVREGYELPELGYVIGVPWQGRGLAKEVCRGILAYAKEEFGFEQIQAVIQRENEPSLRLIRELGFVEKEEIQKEEKVYKIFSLPKASY